MSEKKQPILLMVEDSPTLAAVYRGYLKQEEYQVVHQENGQLAMEYLKQHVPDVVLLDLKLPDMDGMDILKYIHEQAMPVSVVIMTAYGSVDMAVDAMRYGALDFIEKPFNASRLIVTLRNALEHHKLNTLIADWREHFECDHYYGFIGASLPMQAVYRIIDSAAASYVRQIETPGKKFKRGVFGKIYFIVYMLSRSRYRHYANESKMFY